MGIHVAETRTMSYRIPAEKDVVRAIENCLARTPHMKSQTELCNAVSAELACIDPDYRIGAERIRRIGVTHGLFSLEIRYARTSRKSEYDCCPVCGGSLTSVKNRTIEGGTVDLTRKCRNCGYSVRGNTTRPARYTINRRLRADSEGRILQLRRAQELMMEAARIIDDAMHMSGMEPRTGKVSEALRDMAYGQKDGGSLSNVIADLEYMSEEQPCWTQPLVSPKNQF